MEELLFLAHRIPYPPNKGDKIRSFHLLRCLASRYRVHLGAFIDDPADKVYEKNLREICAGTCLLPLSPLQARIRSLKGLVSGEALSIPYYRNTRMQRWVRDLVDRGKIDKVLVFSSAMAQYVLGEPFRKLHRVADYVDVDSDKWRQYVKSRRWPVSSLYWRESHRLLAFERAVADELDQVVFVSDAEAELFRSLSPGAARRVSVVENGVDTEYFSPERRYLRPYGTGDRVIVFTGAMDYWANVDAVQWFATEVFPRVRRQFPQCCFYIVGARPSETVRRLGLLDGVVVTGSVPDVRPYLAHADLAVAPLRIARGVQNKVLEAMAMARVIVSTSHALDGLERWEGFGSWEADMPEDFAGQILRIFREGDAGMGELARSWVCERYDWNRSCVRLLALFERVSVPPESAQRGVLQDTVSS